MGSTGKLMSVSTSGANSCGPVLTANVQIENEAVARNQLQCLHGIRLKYLHRPPFLQTQARQFAACDIQLEDRAGELAGRKAEPKSRVQKKLQLTRCKAKFLGKLTPDGCLGRLSRQVLSTKQAPSSRVPNVMAQIT